jgi:hypothetical protein
MTKEDKEKADGVKAYTCGPANIAVGALVQLNTSGLVVVAPGFSNLVIGALTTPGVAGQACKVQKFDALIPVTVFSDGDGSGIGTGTPIAKGDQLTVGAGGTPGAVTNTNLVNAGAPIGATSVLNGEGSFIAVSALPVNTPGAPLQVVLQPTREAARYETTTNRPTSGSAGLLTLNNAWKLGTGVIYSAPEDNGVFATADDTPTQIIQTYRPNSPNTTPAEGTVFSIVLEMLARSGTTTDVALIKKEALFTFNFVGSLLVATQTLTSLIAGPLAGIDVSFVPADHFGGGSINIMVTGLPATGITWYGTFVETFYSNI